MPKSLDPVQPIVTLAPISLPLDLKTRIRVAAKKEGIGLAEAVRNALKEKYGAVQLPIPDHQ